MAITSATTWKSWSDGKGPEEGDEDLEGPAVDPLAAERTGEACGHLETFGAMLHSLEKDDWRGWWSRRGKQEEASVRNLLPRLEP